MIGGRGVQGVIFTLELDSGNLAGELAIGTCSGHLVARHRQSDNAVERRSVEVLVHEHTTAPIGDAEITDQDRKSVVSGKSVSVRVDLGGRRILKKKKILEQYKV